MNSRVDHPSAGSSHAANLLSKPLPTEFYQNDWLCVENNVEEGEQEEETSKLNPFYAEYAELLMASKTTSTQAAANRNRAKVAESLDFLEVVPLNYQV